MQKFKLVGADTDSILICKENEEFLSKEERKNLLAEINSYFPEKIHWEDDGYYPVVLVLKAKNYVLKDESGKLKIKGSALKSSKTEPALKEYMGKVIDNLLKNDVQSVVEAYKSYVLEINNVTDITRWAAKKTITEKVLNPQRTNEQKVLDAIEEEDYQMGDKILVYENVEKKLQLVENWTNNHNKAKLLKRLYDTTKIFSNVIDITLFPNYTLKKNQKLLDEVVRH